MGLKRKWLGLIVAALALSACESWLVPEPTPISWVIPTGPATTPSALPDVLGDTATPMTATITPTITLTPRFSPTPPLGATTTVSWIMLTATAGGPSSITDPRVDYFVAYPTEAKPGDLISLFWKTTNASDAAIWRVKDDGTPGRTWKVDTEGQMSLETLASGRQETFVLSVTNGIKTVEATVAVTIGCDAKWFFTPEPDTGCPEAAGASTGAVFQGFERGQMFWMHSSNQMIVLFTDGTQPAWISVGNGWVEGMPEEDPAFAPPEGFRQPRREFGLAWRDTPGLRERLGWGIGDPAPFSSTFQNALYGEGKRGMYFTDPTNAIIQLVPGGEGWLVVGYGNPPAAPPAP